MSQKKKKQYIPRPINACACAVPTYIAMAEREVSAQQSRDHLTTNQPFQTTDLVPSRRLEPDFTRGIYLI